MKLLCVTLILFFASSDAFAQETIKSFAQRSGKLHKSAARLAMSQKRMRAIPNLRSTKKLFEWIQSSIEYEPYVGSIRGPQGVLVSGRGNSIDVALLIASELKSKGKKIRFATVDWSDIDRKRLTKKFVGSATLISSESINATQNRTNSPIPRMRTYVEVLKKGKWLPVDPFVDPYFGRPKSETPLSIQDNLSENQLGTIEIEVIAKFSDGQRRTLFQNKNLINEIHYSDWALSFEPSPAMVGNIIPILQSSQTRQKADDFPPEQLSRLYLNVKIKQRGFQNRNERTLFEAKDDQGFKSKDAVFTLHLFGSWTDFDWAGTQIASQMMNLSNALQGWSGDAMGEEPDSQKRRFVKWLNDSRTAMGTAVAFAYIASLDQVTRDLARTLGVQPFIAEPRLIIVSSVPGKDKLHFRLEPLIGKIDSQAKRGVPEGARLGFHSLFGVVEANLRSATEALFIKQPVWYEKVNKATTIHIQKESRSLGRSDRKRLKKESNMGKFVLAELPLSKAEGWWSLLPESGTIRSNRFGIHSRLVEGSQKLNNFALAKEVLVAAENALTFFKRKKPLLRSKPAVCSSYRHLKTLAGSFCAKDKAIPAPNLLRCMELKSRQDIVINGTCRERSEYFRCGAVIAGSLLSKKLTVMYTGEQSAFEILSATKKKKRTKATGIICK